MFAPNVVLCRLRCLCTALLVCAPIVGFATEFVFETEFGNLGTAVGQFDNPRAIAIDAQNRIVIADRGNHRIQICTDQGVCIAFGSMGSDVGNFDNPQGIAVDSHGHIIVGDFGNNRVQICDTGGTCTAFGGQGSALGQFNGVNGIDVDSQDRIFVADNGNDRVQICDHQGVCSAFSIIGGHGLEVDSQDRIIVSDNLGNQINICNDQGTCTSFGGFGVDPGQFDFPFTVATDSQNRIFVADRNNSRVQMCDDQGNCEAFGVPGSGPSQFNQLSGIAVDNLDRLIVGEKDNHRIQIFSVQPNPPTVTVVAASATYPAGTEQGGFTSMTDDPLGPFSGQSVMFRGIDVGGVSPMYRYRLDFDQNVTLDSIIVEGASWSDGVISLFDAQGIEIKNISVSAGGNSFRRQVLTASGVVGNTFFLEETSSATNWNYRSNIEIELGGAASTNTIEVSVRALIDGISQIKIQDNQLWWHHIQAAAPGRHQNLDEPTNVNGFDWLPVWPFNDDGRDCDCESDRLNLFNAGIQLTNDLELLELRVVNARDSATLIQSPSAGNGFLSLIELDDPSSGSAWYEVVAVYGSKSLITIPGTANPWLAGMPDGSTAAGGDVAPDQSPVLAPTTITPGIALSFFATGLANNDSGGGVGPDGKAEYQFHTAENGIADGNMPLSALAGVFLDQSQPDQSALPPILDFGAGGNVPDGTNYTNLSPQLKQVFFVGDGQTDSGVAQQVIPPAGATRVFLGIMDGSQYNNNSGEFEVEISDGTPPVNNVPAAVDDNVNADTGVSVVIDVLNNDQQLADTPIVVSVSADPTNGTAIAGADNDVTYTSTPGFVGDDNFQYTATDRDGDASSATVTITVVDPNTNVLPIANDDSASVRVDIQFGGNVVINVLANDLGLNDEPITVDIYSSPATGTIVVLTDYRISYTTYDASTNEDTFEYRVTDANGDWAIAKVTVSIQASTVDDGSSNNSNKKKGGGAINPLFLLALFLAILRSNVLRSRVR